MAVERFTVLTGRELQMPVRDELLDSFLRYALSIVCLELDFHARAQIAKRFPANVVITEARNTVIADYPRHTEYSTADCEKWSNHTVPDYTFRGGPCIFGIVEVGSTWWGYESAVMFRLIFGSNGRLAELQVQPVYTFL